MSLLVILFQSYFQTGQAPMVLHYVVRVQKGVKLINQPLELLPEMWRKFVQSLNLVEGTKAPVSDKSTVTFKSAINMKNTTASNRLNGQVPSVDCRKAKNPLTSCNSQKSTIAESLNGPGPSRYISSKQHLPSVTIAQPFSQILPPNKVIEKKIPKKRTVKSQALTICQAMLSRVDLVRPVKSSLKSPVEKPVEKEKSTTQNTPRVRFKLKSDPPKVRFAIKFGDNARGYSTKISTKRKILNGDEDRPKNFHVSDSSSGDETCLQNGIDHDSSEQSEFSGTTKCTDNDVNKSNTRSPSPTLTISHSPKPPSTVKLKKSILKNKRTNQIEVPIDECSLSCPELPTNSNDF